MDIQRIARIKAIEQRGKKLINNNHFFKAIHDLMSNDAVRQVMSEMQSKSDLDTFIIGLQLYKLIENTLYENYIEPDSNLVIAYLHHLMSHRESVSKIVEAFYKDNERKLISSDLLKTKSILPEIKSLKHKTIDFDNITILDNSNMETEN